MKEDRRKFLQLLARAAAAGAVTTGGALLLHNRTPRHDRVLNVSLPDFRERLREPENSMSIVEGGDTYWAVDKAIEALGGMDRFVNPGDIVVVKPNVGFDRPPSFGATTSPDVVESVVRLCLKAGARHVYVVDNPINNPSRCFTVSGIGAAVENAGGTVMTPDRIDHGVIELGGTVIPSWTGLAGIFRNADRLIGIPTVKDHNLAGISVTMKNWYGFLGEGRNAFHQRLHEVIADLAAAFTPTLVIVDGTRSLIRNGPTGGSISDVIETGQIAAGLDQVALDSWAAELMGRWGADIPSLKLAVDKGVGRVDWLSLEPVRVSSA